MCEDDIWYRDAGDCYEYVATYVDDLCIVAKDPEDLLTKLQGKPFSFKLKGSHPIENTVHLGSGFSRDPDNVLTMNPKTYIERMKDSYKQRFPNEELKTNVKSPLEPGVHPEIDASDFLNEDDTLIYQSLIGAMQWAISIGRW